MSDTKQDNADQEFDTFLETETEEDEAGSDDTDGAADSKVDRKSEQPVDELSPSIREQQRQKQVDAWTRRILDEGKDLTDLPKDQQWLKPYIQEQLRNKDVSYLVEQKLQEELAKRDAQQRQEYERQRKGELLQEARQLELDEVEKAEMAAKVDALEAKGLSKLAAFEEGMEFIKLIRESSESKREELRKRMSIPVVKGTNADDRKLEYDGSEDFFKQKDSKSRVAAMEARLSRRD